jgi:hypothetical protein
MALALHARVQALHQLVSGGLLVELNWVEEAWHAVAATKSVEERVGVELVLSESADRSVQIMLGANDACLMQAVTRAGAGWVEACAIATCRVRALDSEGHVCAEFVFK